jgi:hypothetical protein
MAREEIEQFLAFIARRGILLTTSDWIKTMEPGHIPKLVDRDVVDWLIMEFTRVQRVRPRIGAEVFCYNDIVLSTGVDHVVERVPANTPGIVVYHLSDDYDAVGVRWHRHKDYGPPVTIEVNVNSLCRVANKASFNFPLSNKLEQIPADADLHTLKQFESDWESGVIGPDDGVGYYATESMVTDVEYVHRGTDIWTHVVWFNK